MAIIKKIPINRYAATDYKVGEYQTPLAISPNGEGAFAGDNCFDADTLFPLTGKEPTALNFNKGQRCAPVTKTLLTTRPAAVNTRGVLLADFPTQMGYTNPIRVGQNTYEQNMSFTRNLDKTGRQSFGHFIPFQDAGGVDHFIFVNQGNVRNRTANTCPYGSSVGTQHEIILVQGTSLSSPDAVATEVYIPHEEVRISGSVGGGSYWYRGDILHPLYVDPINRKLYCLATYNTYYTNATYDYNRLEAILVFSFTTVASGGTLALTPAPFGTINWLQTRQGPLGAQGHPGLRYGIPRPHYYIGKNLAGDPCFMVTREQDVGSFSYNITVGMPMYAGAVVNWNKSGNFLHYFQKVDRTNGSTVTDLTGNNTGMPFTGLLELDTDCRRYTGNIHPSHFEPSPIAGESNIFYAYNIVMSDQDGSLDKATFVRYKWDKNDDTFSLAVCTADIALNTMYTDLMGNLAAKADVQSNAHHVGLGLEFSTNVILTKSGSNYYLSVLGCFGTANAVSFSSPRNNVLATYQLDASDMTSLSFSSSKTLQTCMSYVSGNVDNTELLLICQNSAMVLGFSGGAWLTNHESVGSYISIGKDQEDRYWGVSTDQALQSMTAGILSVESFVPGLAQRASVEFEDAEISYSGTPLSKNILVNAYDEVGARVVSDVILKITGNSAVFTSNGARILSVTTNGSADTVIPLTISNGGLINISASFEI